MREMTDENWTVLPAPSDWGTAERKAFVALAEAIAAGAEGPRVQAARRACAAAGKASLAAAGSVLCDLASQGWAVEAGDVVRVTPALAVADVAGEKERIRRQELVKRDEQLSVPSVRRFVTSMERPREYRGAFVSVFSLMRDGRELRAALEDVAAKAQQDPSSLRTAVDPYVQVVRPGERDQHTGLLLGDVWRYFRHTWTNYYATTPGRTMQLLVRDRAAPFHPVIGIAALSSAIVQIKERDDWIGWQPDKFLAALAARPTDRMARWVTARLDRALSELYLDDLVKDGLYWPDIWESPSADAIERLAKEAKARRQQHHRFARKADFKSRSGKGDDETWRLRAESDLFRSKRCLVLADLLRAHAGLHPFLWPTATANGLRKALEDPQGRRAIAGILRRAKGESVGTEMADLAVCGAVAPYNAILGGKLVGMLAASPTVVRAYRDKYSGYQSEIASAMAGRPIRRSANLAFIGTTSLYGAGASQYNRIKVPAGVLDGSADIVYRELGRSKSYGTSHLSAESVNALVRLSEQSQTGIRVNSIFGEGVNPKLRKVRYGLDLLGWPAGELLQHGRQRIVYGISLVGNLLPYLIGAEDKPDYIFPLAAGDDMEKISGWWMQRWLAHRIQSGDVLAEVARHEVDRPAVSHGARVALPVLPEPEGSLFLGQPGSARAALIRYCRRGPLSSRAQRPTCARAGLRRRSYRSPPARGTIQRSSARRSVNRERPRASAVSVTVRPSANRDRARASQAGAATGTASMNAAAAISDRTRSSKYSAVSSGTRPSWWKMSGCASGSSASWGRRGRRRVPAGASLARTSRAASQSIVRR